MKFYVHHKYSSNLFWYLFHGTDVEQIPSYYFDIQNSKDVEINTTYNDTVIDIIFCDDRYWDKLDGNHIIDSHVKGMELGINDDRGYNHKFYNYLIHEFVPNLKDKAKILKDKLHFFYIDWEGYTHVSRIGLTHSPHIQVFADEFKKSSNWKIGNYKNHIYVFTQVINSFIHTSGLGIKNFYFFHDYLKHKTDYKYKLSYSVRRMTHHKLENTKEFLKLGNDALFTYSSYGYQDDTVDLTIKTPLKEFNENIKPFLPKESFINKRGCGIHDWGSEENRNNIDEMMYKILPLAEIELIDEYIEDGQAIDGCPRRPEHLLHVSSYRQRAQYGNALTHGSALNKRLKHSLGHVGLPPELVARACGCNAARHADVKANRKRRALSDEERADERAKAAKRLSSVAAAETMYDQ